MPIYVLVCKSCKHKEEKLVRSYKDLDDYTCSQCKGPTMRVPALSSWKFSERMKNVG